MKGSSLAVCLLGGALAQLGCASTPVREAAPVAHFFGEDGKPWPQYERVWEDLKTFYGEVMPPRITVALLDGGSGGGHYDPEHDIISLDRKLWEEMGADLVAHETSHRCLAVLTKGVSSTEAFRFMDEGLAQIIGRRNAGKAQQYKTDALILAAVRARKHDVSFAKVQRWSEYFGQWQFGPTSRPTKERDFGAYQVGASFDFLVMDRYGEAKLRALFVEIGKSNDLDASLRKVLGRSAAEVEADWLAYLAKVAIPTPRVVEFVPANGSEGVSPELSEIRIRFDVDMNTEPRNLNIITQDSAISFENAHWKSRTVLAIRLPQQLNGGTLYKVQLGRESRPLLSRNEVSLPITSWQFKTK